MPLATCPNCQQSFQAPDGLARAHCVRCGNVVVLETGITATPLRESPADIQPIDQFERSPTDGRVEQPLQDTTWDEFRASSASVHRELMVLIGRPLPDLRGLTTLPLPVNLPPTMDDWGRPLGTIVIPGESRRTNKLASWLVIPWGLTTAVGGVVFSIYPPDDHGQPNHTLGPILAITGAASFGLGIWLGYIRKPVLMETLWFFEEGILLSRYGKSRACRWENIQKFESSNETGRPLYWLTLDHDTTVIISLGHDPNQVIPLMEYAEIRMSGSQFLRRLQTIWTGRKERFGVLAMDREGIRGPRFFARWPEIRRVVSDSRSLFVDWARSPEWLAVPYRDVSFPYLFMALAHVMIDEHARLPQVDA